MTKNSVKITKRAPTICDVCRSPDVWFDVSFFDRDNPRTMTGSGGKVHFLPDYTGHPCKEHVKEITDRLLERADLLPPDPDAHVSNILEAIEFDIEEAKEAITKENVIRRFREAGYPMRLLAQVHRLYNEHHTKPNPEDGHP